MTGWAPVAFASAAVIIAPRLKIGPFGARVGRRVAAGQEPRAGEHRPGRALELGEVDDVGCGDEDRVGARRPSTSRTPARSQVLARAARCRTAARPPSRPCASRYDLDAAQRRQHLVVGDVQPGRAQARGERLRRLVAAVREERERPARGADPRQHLARPGLDVDLVAGPVHERPVDVEHEASTSSSRTAPLHQVVALLHAQVRDRLAPRDLLQQRRDRVAAVRPRRRPEAGGDASIASTCSSGIVSRSSSSSSEIRAPEARAGSLELERLELAQLLDARLARARARRRPASTGAAGSP